MHAAAPSAATFASIWRSLVAAPSVPPRRAPPSYARNCSDLAAQGDGTRIFYESLLKENPQSDIAFKWCVEHGIYLDLDPHKAARRLEKKNLQRKARAAGVPVKKKKKKQRVDAGLTAGEIGMSVGGGWEGIGRSTM